MRVPRKQRATLAVRRRRALAVFLAVAGAAPLATISADGPGFMLPTAKPADPTAVQSNPFCETESQRPSRNESIQLASGTAASSTIRLKPIGTAIGLRAIGSPVTDSPKMTIEELPPGEPRKNPLVESTHRENRELVDANVDDCPINPFSDAPSSNGTCADGPNARGTDLEARRSILLLRPTSPPAAATTEPSPSLGVAKPTGTEAQNLIDPRIGLQPPTAPAAERAPVAYPPAVQAPVTQAPITQAPLTQDPTMQPPVASEPTDTSPIALAPAVVRAPAVVPYPSGSANSPAAPSVASIPSTSPAASPATPPAIVPAAPPMILPVDSPSSAPVAAPTMTQPLASPHPSGVPLTSEPVALAQPLPVTDQILAEGAAEESDGEPIEFSFSDLSSSDAVTAPEEDVHASTDSDVNGLDELAGSEAKASAEAVADGEEVKLNQVEPVVVDAPAVSLESLDSIIEESDGHPIAMHDAKPIVAEPVTQKEPSLHTRRYRPPVAVKMVPIAVARESEEASSEPAPTVQHAEAPQLGTQMQIAGKSAKVTPLYMGRAQVRSLTLGGDVHNVKVADPSVCQAFAAGPNQLKLIGTGNGITRLVVWAKVGDDQPKTVVRAFEVHVEDAVQATGDSIQNKADMLNQSIRNTFPSCRVSVQPMQGHLVARGRCDSESSAKKIMRMVRKTCLIPVKDELVVR